MDDDQEFWLEVRSILLRLVCAIEKRKLRLTCTTADLRKIGKQQMIEQNKSLTNPEL